MKHVAPFVLLALAACGGAAREMHHPEPPLEGTATPAALAASSVVTFGRFAAPVPPGFKAGKSSTDPVAVLMHGKSAVVYLGETRTPVPDDMGRCQGFVQGATAGVVEGATGEKIEVEVANAGALDTRPGLLGGCWVAAAAKGDTDRAPPYITAALRFGSADALVFCLVTGADPDDARACQAIIAGVHEASAE